jgi:RNA polymerase sigma-70 factor (ECF subfamily)
VLRSARTGKLLRARRQGTLLHARLDGEGRLWMSVTEALEKPVDDQTWQDLHRRLFDFISRRVTGRENAEDILQEVMLRIHRHRGEVLVSEAVGAWIYRIAQNAIIDHYRRASTRREIPVALGDEWEELAGTASGTPPPDEIRRELAVCLAPLVQRLPAKYRDAIVITEFEGVSQVEAARRLGLSVSGMKARVQRARVQLKGLLLACCDVEVDSRGGLIGYRAPNGCGCSPP